MWEVGVQNDLFLLPPGKHLPTAAKKDHMGSNSIICELVANESQNIMCSYFSETS